MSSLVNKVNLKIYIIYINKYITEISSYILFIIYFENNLFQLILVLFQVIECVLVVLVNYNNPAIF